MYAEKSVVSPLGIAILERDGDTIKLTVDRAVNQTNSGLMSASADEEPECREKSTTLFIPEDESQLELIYEELSVQLEDTLALMGTGSNTYTDGDLCNCAQFTLTVNYTKEYYQ